MKTSIDIHQHVTDLIIAAIESGVSEPKFPWDRLGLSNMLPRNALSRAMYRGINIVSLWASALANNFEHGIWATFEQWRSLDCSVRKGAKGNLIVSYCEIEVEPDPSRETDDGKRHVIRHSWVFNCAQVDGYTPLALPSRTAIDRVANADALIHASGALIHCKGEHACYRLSEDAIYMADEPLFSNENALERASDYYSVLFHELTHRTGAKHRLNRDLGNRFGDPQYALEELIAELGSAFIMAELGISPAPRADHACYINNWLQALKSDSRAIFTAAARASERGCAVLVPRRAMTRHRPEQEPTSACMSERGRTAFLRHQ